MTRISTVPVCDIHGNSKVKINGEWHCKDCLFASNLTYETQRQAIARYNKSEVGREAAKRYTQTEKGKKTREKYLKSPKYKAARKAYNKRLQESLATARMGRSLADRSSKVTGAELVAHEDLAGLLAEIREYIDTNLRPPTVKNIVATAKRDYMQTITEAKARELIDAAINRKNHSGKH